jgi:hypothetical protein
VVQCQTAESTWRRGYVADNLSGLLHDESTMSVPCFSTCKYAPSPPPPHRLVELGEPGLVPLFVKLAVVMALDRKVRTGGRE